MKLSICKVKRIERETGLMCLDDCIATVAEYYHCGYEMSYAGGFAMRWRSGFTNFAGQYQIHLLDRLEKISWAGDREKEFFLGERGSAENRKGTYTGTPGDDTDQSLLVSVG